MVAPIDQIERELRTLERATAEVAQTLRQACADYLDMLGQTTRQQVVLASYHLCTQNYPQQFLGLSMRQRQDLQQQVQKLGRQAQQQITEQAAIVAQLLTAEPAAPIAIDPATTTILPVDDSTPGSLVTDGGETMIDVAASGLQPTNPLHLLRLLSRLDELMIGILQGLSQTTNRHLQKAGILPPQLPEPIFAVMAKAGDAAEAGSTSSPPHLLKILIEVAEEVEDGIELADSAEADEEADEEADPPAKRHLAPLVTIHLRLAELEFGNPVLAARRQKLRNLRQQLDRLAKTYRTKQKQQAIAEAEAAWRASWVEE